MKKTLAAAALLALLAPPAGAQPRHDPQQAIAAQKAAMEKLAILDGAWRGTAWSLDPSGQKRAFIQTERVGPLLDGTVRLVEGRGYDAEGRSVFNAFAVISHDPAKGAYTMRSYAFGHAGDFPIAVRDDGFTWEIPMGPAKTVYRATVRDGRWEQVGERVVPGQAPVRIFEMRLERLGPTDWPAAAPVPAK